METSLGTAAAGIIASSLHTPTPRASASLTASSELPEDAYTLLGGDMKSCKILNGMWQLSGGHGYRPQVGPAVSDMRKQFEAGFNTFDTAGRKCPQEDFDWTKWRHKPQQAYASLMLGGACLRPPWWGREASKKVTLLSP